MSTLLEAQRHLQADADAVVRDLGLEQTLRPLGTAFRVGSSAMGLMVRRDIDITIVCEALDSSMLETVANIGARLMQHPMVSGVRFRNDSGGWNAEPDRYPDGLYLGLTVSAGDGATWTLDIWTVDDAARQPDLAHLQTLLPRITEPLRETILGIKHVLAARSAEVRRVPSAWVYEAVVDHQITTVEQFDAWAGNR